MKEVEFGDVAASELRVKPNLPVLGPKLGAALRDVRARLARGEFEELEGGRFRVDAHELERDEVLVERVGLEGWAVAADDGLTVALDTSLDDELRLEADLYDLIRDGAGAAEGERPRDHGSDPSVDPGRAPAAVLGSDRRGDTRRFRRGGVRASAREGLPVTARVGLAVAAVAVTGAAIAAGVIATRGGGDGGGARTPTDDPGAFAISTVG